MQHRIGELSAGRRMAATLSAMAGAVILAGTVAVSAQSSAPYLAKFPNFAPALTPQLPGDIDAKLKTTLENAGKFAQVQREFDLNAWQMFLAVNWPTSNQGQPARRITDTASASRTGRCGITAARSSRSTACRRRSAAVRRRARACSRSAAT